jgi:hypothetical protein
MAAPYIPGLNSTAPSSQNNLLDRTQWQDYLVVAITALCSLVLLICAIILIFIRNYEPIKNKQIHIILPSTFSGIIFMLSSLVVNNHFIRAQDSFWALCVFWTFWINLTLGLAPWLSCLILRPFRLLYIFRFRKAIKPLKTMLILGIMITPWIIFSTFAQIFNGWAYNTQKMICENNGIGWTIGIFFGIGLYILTYLIVTGLLYKIRKDQRFEKYLSQYYYEFPIIKIGVIIVLVMTVANAVVWIVKQALLDNVSNDAKAWGRLLLTLTSVFMVTFFFFATVAKPMFKYFFDRDRYLVIYRTSMSNIRQQAVESTTAEVNSSEPNENTLKTAERQAPSSTNIRNTEQGHEQPQSSQQQTRDNQANETVKADVKISESTSSTSNMENLENERPALSQASAATSNESSSDSDESNKQAQNTSKSQENQARLGY